MNKLLLIISLVIPIMTYAKIGKLKGLRIDSSKVYFNDESIQPPFELAELKEVLGKPRKREGNVNDLYIWNRYGIMCYCQHKSQNVNSIDITYSYNWFANPIRLFRSDLVIDGKNIFKIFKKKVFLALGFEKDGLPQYLEYKFGNFKILVEFHEKREKLIGISIDQL